MRVRTLLIELQICSNTALSAELMCGIRSRVVRIGYHKRYLPLEHALGPPGRAAQPTQGFFLVSAHD